MNKLSEKEELLLVKFVDNECGFIEKLIVRRLVKQNPFAAEFVQSLNSLSDEFTASQLALNEASLKGAGINLWDRISRRIEQEEKAAIYLGSRNHEIEVKKSPIFEWNKINFGMGTGLVAACLALFMMYGNFRKSASSYQQPVILSKQNLQGGISAVNYSQPLSDNQAKIDWIRSNAKIKMIKESDKQLPVIWVNRSLPSRSSAARVSPYNVPNLDLFDLQDSQNSNQPIILNDKVPNALSVVSKNSVAK